MGRNTRGRVGPTLNFNGKSAPPPSGVGASRYNPGRIRTIWHRPLPNVRDTNPPRFPCGDRPPAAAARFRARAVRGGCETGTAHARPPGARVGCGSSCTHRGCAAVARPCGDRSPPGCRRDRRCGGDRRSRSTTCSRPRASRCCCWCSTASPIRTISAPACAAPTRSALMPSSSRRTAPSASTLPWRRPRAAPPTRCRSSP